MQKSSSKFENEKTLFIGNLSDQTFDNDLFKFFKANGHQVAKAKVMIDQFTQKSKNFGYLNFKSEEQAVKCLETMNNVAINGK